MRWVATNEMEANPSKFQAMFSDPSPDISVSFKDVTIHNQTCVKLLGVNIDHKLSFNKHISDLCHKAARQINVLQRFKRILKWDVKRLLYKSFVLAHFNYCPAVWHHCGRDNTLKLERLQYRALKFVFNDYSSPYELLLKKANLPSLDLIRLRSTALEVYKSYHSLNPSYLNDLVQERKPLHEYTLRRQGLIHVKPRTNHGLHSFKHTSVNIWNSLPTELREAADYTIFKKLIKTWSGFRCNCAVCHYERSLA